MKNKNTTTGFSDPLEDEEAVARLLRDGLDRLEEWTPVLEPDLHTVELWVEEQQKTIRRRFIRDLSLFLCAAMGILTVLAAALLKQPVVFLALQGAALAVAPAILLLKERKRVGDS